VSVDPLLPFFPGELFQNLAMNGFGIVDDGLQGLDDVERLGAHEGIVSTAASWQQGSRRRPPGDQEIRG
jgi:hypothetical protein